RYGLRPRPRPAAFPYTTLFRSMLEAQIVGLEAELKAAREAYERRIPETRAVAEAKARVSQAEAAVARAHAARDEAKLRLERMEIDRKSTRLNSSHVKSSYAGFC